MDSKELYQILDRFPRFTLFSAPTPIQKMHNLSRELGAELFIKRDDLTGLAAGGNKTRKLEYLIGKALAEDADTLITAGWYHSNHALQTAAAACKAGMKAILVLKGRPCYRGSLFLDRLTGADIHLYEAPSSSALTPYMEEIAEESRKNGGNPFIIPVGGSNPVGAMGYVRGAAEIANQVEESGLNFDYVVCPTSSGGTQSGLMWGLRNCIPETRMLGVGVGDSRDEVIDGVYRILLGLSELLERLEWDRETLEAATVTDYGFGAYAHLAPEVTGLIRHVASREGLFLDPVYTGKAFFGLVGMIHSGKIPHGSRILFVHTGGLSSLFQYEEELLIHLESLHHQNGKKNES